MAKVLYRIGIVRKFDRIFESAQNTIFILFLFPKFSFGTSNIHTRRTNTNTRRHIYVYILLVVGLEGLTIRYMDGRTIFRENTRLLFFELGCGYTLIEFSTKIASQLKWIGPQILAGVQHRRSIHRKTLPSIRNAKTSRKMIRSQQE